MSSATPRPYHVIPTKRFKADAVRLKAELGEEAYAAIRNGFSCAADLLERKGRNALDDVQIYNVGIVRADTYQYQFAEGYTLTFSEVTERDGAATYYFHRLYQDQ